jgi:hypothetical protein
VAKNQYMNRVAAPIGRAVFPHLYAPDDSQYGNGRYALTIRYDKDTPGLDALKATIAKFATDCFADKNINLRDVKMPLLSGDAMADGNPRRAPFRGFMILRAKTSQKPTLVDNTKLASGEWAPLQADSPHQIRTGTFVRAVLTLMTYEIDENITIVENGQRRQQVVKTYGIKAIPAVVQYVKDGESINVGGEGGGRSDAHVMGDLPADMVAPAAPAPTAGGGLVGLFD